MKDKVFEIIKKQINDREVKLDSKLVEDLEVDSLKMMEILYNIEYSLNIEVKYGNLKNLRTVNDLINSIILKGDSTENEDEIL